MKHVFNLLAFALMSSTLAQVPGHVPADGLVAWYPFNGNALDESGNAANGTIHGATPTEDRNGVSSAAFHFDGQSWLSASPLGLPNGDASRSVSAWLNPSTVAGPFTLTAVAYGAPSTSSAFMVGLYNQGIAVQGWADDFGTEVDYSADEWMHVVCTFAASSIKIYFNGVLIEEGENTTWNTMDGPLILGSRVDLANSYFEGSIDDVGIWNRALHPAEVVALYNGVTSVPGCTDADACNFSEEANVDDGSCIACSVFAERCGDGTIWDAEMQMCIGDGSGDINLDGCVQLNDLLDLLSAYGNCAVEESAWQCGNPLDYQGYDYETVQIGEQCWFAENLKKLDVVYPGTSQSYDDPRSYVYGYNGENVNEAILQANYDEFGVLYNYAAVQNEDLCPAGWTPGTDEDWNNLAVALGVDSTEAHTYVCCGGAEFRGDVAPLMKHESWSGLNTSGFGALPGGYLNDTPSPSSFLQMGVNGYFWTTSEAIQYYAPQSTLEQIAMSHYLYDGIDGVGRIVTNRQHAFSVRCVKDAE